MNKPNTYLYTGKPNLLLTAGEAGMGYQYVRVKIQDAPANDSVPVGEYICLNAELLIPLSWHKSNRKGFMSYTDFLAWLNPAKVNNLGQWEPMN